MRDSSPQRGEPKSRDPDVLPIDVFQRGKPRLDGPNRRSFHRSLSEGEEPRPRSGPNHLFSDNSPQSQATAPLREGSQDGLSGGRVRYADGPHQEREPKSREVRGRASYRRPSERGATSSGQPSLASSSSESSSWSALRESRMVSGRCAPGITNIWSPLASSHANTTRW